MFYIISHVKSLIKKIMPGSGKTGESIDEVDWS